MHIILTIWILTADKVLFEFHFNLNYSIWQ